MPLLHSVYFAVRGTNWEVLPSHCLSETRTDAPGKVILSRRDIIAQGFLSEMSIEAQETGSITLDVHLTCTNAIEVNRAGFNILFPIDNLAGQSAEVMHSDGAVEQGHFPDLISPEQPFFDMQSISYQLQSARVSVAFEGDVFEMEDQRNWSDASFKVYGPPLATPRPRRFRTGEEIRQRVVIKVTGKPSRPARAKNPKPRKVVMPEILLMAGKETPSVALPKGARRLVRFQHDKPWRPDELGRLSGNDPIDAEIVLPPDLVSAETYLRNLARDMRRADLKIAHVVALPAGYLKRLPPGGASPPGLDLAGAADLAAKTFPDARLGMGALTHFTELNRRRPPQRQGAYITHGNAAIVHAADDQSVLETLIGLRHVLHSACAIAGERDYRLGLVAIAMRSNPHGDHLFDNPDQHRMAMTDDDPRQHTGFAAAYAIAATTLAALAGAEAICLGGVGGTFSIADQNGDLRPIGRVIEQMAALSGQRAEATHADGIYRLSIGKMVLTANCTLSEHKLPKEILAEGILLLGTEAIAGTHTRLPPMSCHISMPKPDNLIQKTEPLR